LQFNIYNLKLTMSRSDLGEKEMLRRIGVLVVDDSPTKRGIICSMINSQPDMGVVGEAVSGEDAMRKCWGVNPDVITMDIKMPGIDGLEATKRIMTERPTPILIVSSTAKVQVKFTLEAIKLGALDFVGVVSDLEKMKEDLLKKIRIASKVKVVRYIEPKKSLERTKIFKSKASPYKVIAVGVSTGGPAALLSSLSKIPQDFPATIIIVQHIVEGFSRGLAEWLDSQCSIKVKEAEDRDFLSPGLALIAPAGNNLLVSSTQTIKLKSIPPDALYKPSIDEMMTSCARVYGPLAVGIILTGMGQDGVEGIKAIKKAGGLTLAQDKDSSAIFGMPKLAIESGYIDKVVALESLPSEIMSLF